MQPNLYLRFQGSDEELDSNISLAELGESLQGFDAVFKEFARILRIELEPEVQATSHREGSLIIEIAAWWKDTSDGLPFHSVDDFITFLRLAKEPLADEVEAYFNSALETRKTLNDWVSAHPIDAAFWTYVFGKAARRLMKHAGACKRLLLTDVRELPRRMQLALQKLIKKKGFQKALKPMTENKVDVIEVSDDPKFAESAKVDQSNLADYLADDDTILPHLKDGNVYELNGVVTSLKATRGDRLTLQIRHEGIDYNLDALPRLGLTSKSYIDYYRESVHVTAEVMRSSLFKKPKLRIHEIELQQPELGLKIEETEPSRPLIQFELTKGE
jgi:hypothetical protein